MSVVMAIGCRSTIFWKKHCCSASSRFASEQYLPKGEHPPLNKNYPIDLFAMVFLYRLFKGDAFLTHHGGTLRQLARGPLAVAFLVAIQTSVGVLLAFGQHPVDQRREIF